MDEYHKIIVLDKRFGRIDGIIKTFQPSVGSVISYHIEHKRARVVFQDSTLLYTPLSLSYQDLQFFHHIFEIIYYFAPVGSCVYGVFDILAFLYTVEHMLITMKFKKIFLFKLFTMLGLIVSSYMHDVLFDRLKAVSIDQLNSIVMTDDEERQLDVVLWDCIMQHPCGSKFKTIHFLEYNRIL